MLSAGLKERSPYQHTQQLMAARTFNPLLRLPCDLRQVTLCSPGINIILQTVLWQVTAKRTSGVSLFRRPQTNLGLPFGFLLTPRQRDPQRTDPSDLHGSSATPCLQEEALYLLQQPGPGCSVAFLQGNHLGKGTGLRRCPILGDIDGYPW